MLKITIIITKLLINFIPTALKIKNALKGPREASKLYQKIKSRAVGSIVLISSREQKELGVFIHNFERLDGTIQNSANNSEGLSRFRLDEKSNSYFKLLYLSSRKKLMRFIGFSF